MNAFLEELRLRQNPVEGRLSAVRLPPDFSGCYREARFPFQLVFAQAMLHPCPNPGNNAA
jgi:hypothetical protein